NGHGWAPCFAGQTCDSSTALAVRASHRVRRFVSVHYSSFRRPLHQGPSARRMLGEATKMAVTPPTGENAMDLGLQGKHAIVTGGSRGIGKAIARELAREGVDVAIVARSQDALAATARELGAETNRRIVPLAAD